MYSSRGVQTARVIEVILNTVMRAVAWTITRRLTNDLYDVAKKKKPTQIVKRKRRNAGSKEG